MPPVPADYDEITDEEDLSEEEEVAPKKRKAAKAAKDPSKPKRAMSAFFHYSQEMRPVVKAENDSLSFGEVARKLAEMWKDASPKEKAKYEKLAAKDKERYSSEMKGYVPSEGYAKKKGKAGGKKDPDAPKRPMSAYFMFSNENRNAIKEKNPGVTFGGLAKIISEEFKKLSEKELKKYQDKAAADKARYEKEMKAYKA